MPREAASLNQEEVNSAVRFGPPMNGSQSWRVDGHTDAVVGKYPVLADVVDDSLDSLCFVGSRKPHLD